MEFQKELHSICERLFTPDFLQTILAAYQKEMTKTGYTMPQRDYQQGAAALSAILNQAQKTCLSHIQSAYDQNLIFSLKFAFSRGLFYCFQQFFIVKYPFLFRTMEQHTNYFYREMLCQPAYIQVKQTADHNYQLLHHQLPASYRVHLVSIDSALGEKEFGVFRISFRFACLSTLSILRSLYADSKILASAEQDLLLEFETE